jgi:hypothetical protein
MYAFIVERSLCNIGAMRGRIRLRYCTTSRKVAALIPDCVILLPVSLWPLGRLSHWEKWVPEIFHGVLYLRILRKYVAKIKVSLKSTQHNGWFTWRPILKMAHLNLLRIRKFSDKRCREKKHTLHVQ